jgi:hypothetical protein
VVDCHECVDEPLGSGSTELVRHGSVQNLMQHHVPTKCQVVGKNYKLTCKQNASFGEIAAVKLLT